MRKIEIKETVRCARTHRERHLDECIQCRFHYKPEDKLIISDSIICTYKARPNGVNVLKDRVSRLEQSVYNGRVKH